MAFIPWADEYSVGSPVIDQQHRRLLDIINNLHEAMITGGRQADIVKIVDELIAYTKYHFTYEERAMERVDYPDLEDHKRKHEAITNQVENFRREALVGRPTVTLKLMGFLKQWLAKHILETDMRYRACLANLPSVSRPSPRIQR